MTDKEIMKGLECCYRSVFYEYCDKCAYFNSGTGSCKLKLLKDAFDLINRQQAEIDRLKNENEILSKNADTAFQDGLNEAQDLYAEQIKDEIKSEAIKKFAARLNDRIINFPSVYPVENATLAFLNGSSHRQLEILEIIDKLVKEIVGKE